MIKKNIFFALALILLVCANFTTCQNPIIEKWWVDDAEEDFSYVAIIKDVPYLVYQTIVEKEYIYETVYQTLVVEIPVIQTEYVDRPIPPEIMMQYIDIIGIDFVIFAGNGISYNSDAHNANTLPGCNHLASNGTNLTDEEKAYNDAVIKDMVIDLKLHDGLHPAPDNEKYFVILHGHANPVTYTAAETAELAAISSARADAVAAELNAKYGGNLGDGGEKRMTTRGYGGGRNISGSGSAYASLNRRVEVILFTVNTSAVKSAGDFY